MQLSRELNLNIVVTTKCVAEAINDCGGCTVIE